MGVSHLFSMFLYGVTVSTTANTTTTTIDDGD